jgi:hypothetical protein
MMAAKPAIADPLGGLFAEADEVQAGLAQLEHSPPLWGGRLEWLELVARLRAFEVPWGARARLAGWSLLTLYGICREAPRARIGRLGAGFLVALRGHQVVAVDQVGMLLVSRTAARLRLLRGKPDEGTVLAWEVMPPGMRSRNLRAARAGPGR